MHKYKDNLRLSKYLKLYKLDSVINEKLKNYYEFHEFKKGELVCVLNEPLNYFYILLKGSIKVFTTSVDGKNLSLRIFNPITNLGDIELITGTRYRCNVEALTDCLCLSFPINIIETIGLNDIFFLRYLCSDLCNKFDIVASISSHNLLYPLRNRLVSYMMEYKCEDSKTITFPFTYKELAELLGITYRHLTRSFNELEDKGLIKVTDRTIYILDEEELSKLNIDIYPHKI